MTRKRKRSNTNSHHLVRLIVVFFGILLIGATSVFATTKINNTSGQTTVPHNTPNHTSSPNDSSLKNATTPKKVKTTSKKKPAKKPVAAKPKNIPAPRPEPTPKPAYKPKPKPTKPKSSGSNTAKKIITLPKPPNTPPPPGTSVPTPEKAYGSTNWSGYVVDASNFTSISGSWTIPATSGQAGVDALDASWIGIGGFHDSSLVQAGTMNIVTANGEKASAAFYEILPAPAVIIPDMPISEGHNISTNVKEVSANNWRISITNNTTGQNFTITIPYQSSHSVAAWIQEVPSKVDGTLYPIDNFGTVTFTGASAILNGVPINLAHNKLAQITLFKENSNTILAKPKLLSNTSFSVTQQ